MNFTTHLDISWYRRARACSNCSALFLTAEIDEKLLHELVALRQKFVQKRQLALNSVKAANSWIERPETISIELAEGFLRASSWWLTHSSGRPVRAPRHADRVYLDDRHGWAIEFGANKFLVGQAIERAGKKLEVFLDAAAFGEPSVEALKEDLRTAIAGAVANNDGNEYVGYYPIKGNELIFGAQAINLDDAVAYLINKVNVERLLKELQP